MNAININNQLRFSLLAVISPNARRFALGNISATPAALALAQSIAGEKSLNLHDDARPVIQPMLERHRAGDWGDISPEDKAANDRATHDGSHIVSVYLIKGQRFYVITDAKDDDGIRHNTTVLLADEY